MIWGGSLSWSSNWITVPLSQTSVVLGQTMQGAAVFYLRTALLHIVMECTRSYSDSLFISGLMRNAVLYKQPRFLPDYLWVRDIDRDYRSQYFNSDNMLDKTQPVSWLGASVSPLQGLRRQTVRSQIRWPRKCLCWPHGWSKVYSLFLFLYPIV